MNRSATEPLRQASRGALVLASAATGTALGMSALAGWQRGGWLVERIAWIAIGVVLVLNAHLLPAIGQLAGASARRVGRLLWAACMVAAAYGHATFFVWSQQHAGEVRAAVVATTGMTGLSADGSSGVPGGGRALSVIAADHAKVVAALASATARSCRADCPGLKARQAALAATLEALDVEAQEARRRQAAEDRQLQAQQRLATRSDAARHDPVMSTLAAWLGGTPLDVELLGALVLAVALEGVACYGWFLVLVARPGVVSEPVRHGPTATDTELGRVQRAIADGQIRPTVVEIRRHLGCSQAKALQLRRQVAP